jgi:hypothetical protein
MVVLAVSIRGPVHVLGARRGHVELSHTLNLQRHICVFIDYYL